MKLDLAISGVCVAKELQVLRIFDIDDIANGLLAEAIAMIFEILIIVKILEWRRRRDDDRRLLASRQRTRNMLRLRLIDAEAQYRRLANAMAWFRLGPPAQPGSERELPSSSEVVGLLKLVKQDYDDLSRDYVDRLPLLDKATQAVFEAWFDQVDQLLHMYPIRRVLLPEFSDDWGTQLNEDWAVVRRMAEGEAATRQTALIAMSISGSLLYAHDNPKDGDEELLREARQLKDKSHAWHQFKPKAAETLADIEPQVT